MYFGIGSFNVFYSNICMLICSNYIYRVTDNGYEACAWPEIIVFVISNWYFGKYPIDSNFGLDSVRTK